MLRGALGTQRFVRHEEQNRLPHRQNTLTLTPEHARQHDAQAFLFVTLCNTIIYKMTGYTVLSCYVATLDNCNKIKHPSIYSDGNKHFRLWKIETKIGTDWVSFSSVKSQKLNPYVDAAQCIAVCVFFF